MTGHLLEGLDDEALASVLCLPRVALFARLSSTMDEAHRQAAEGAPAGTLVIADEQATGRGRGGRRWSSKPGLGLWLTVLERPPDVSGLDVLSLRVGLRLARALERLSTHPIRLKWPNDLYVGERKLGGILIEARWRAQHLDWVAIGLGVNIVPPPDVSGTAGVGEVITRCELLTNAVPAIREAAACGGPLTATELEDFERRDYARGRRCEAPAAGVARGITPDGALMIESGNGVAQYRTGSLVFAGDGQ